ncbi:MAG: hypothetical protein ABJA67_00430 [Chthonomonadales bacterium]
MGITFQNDTLTLPEIETQFKNEWILVENPVFDAKDKLVSGTVRCHSANRDDVYQRGSELRLRHSAFLYTGKPPENFMINL